MHEGYRWRLVGEMGHCEGDEGDRVASNRCKGDVYCLHVIGKNLPFFCAGEDGYHAPESVGLLEQRKKVGDEAGAGVVY